MKIAYGRIREVFARVRFARVLLVLLLTGTAIYDLRLLTRYPVAAGIDGYYYVLQATSVMQQGAPYFHTNTPVVVYLLGAISYLSKNPVVTVKVTAVLLQLLLCLGIYALLRAVIQAEWLALLGAAIAAISGLRFYLLSEFINNLAAIVFLVWSVWFLIRFIQTKRLLWGICASLLFVAGLFSHRMAPVIVVAMAVFVGLLHVLKTQKKRAVWGAAALIVLLWSLPAIVAAQHLFEPPFGMRGEFSVRPRLPLDRFAFAEEVMVLIGSVLVGLLLFRFRERLENNFILYVFGAVALWSLIVTLNPFLSPEYGWLSVAIRLRALSYIQAAILVPGLLWCALQVQRRLALYLLAGVAPLILMTVFSPLPTGMRPGYLSERQQLAEQLPAAGARLGLAPVVIAAHGDQFMLTAVTGIAARQTRLENNQEQTFWLIRRWSNKELETADVVVRPDSAATSTILIEDSELMARVMRLDVFGRQQILAANPHLASEYSELRRASN